MCAERLGLEISDAGILVGGGDPPAVLRVDHDRAESPGVALQTKGALMVGWEAQRRSRLHPRQCTNRFWSMLSTEPLQERALSAQNYAELAVAHLGSITRAVTVPDPSWVVAAPEFLDQAKLGVLLGVARALEMRVEGIVGNAVAAALPPAVGSSVVHVDVHLHRVELTWLRHTDRLRRESTHLITDGGWERLVDDVARRFADEFVQSTRFDPLHDAASEQSLYDQVVALLQQPPRGQPVPLELKLGRSTYRIAVSPQAVAEASQPLRAKVLQTLEGLRREAVGRGGVLDVQLSHRAARIPGLSGAVAAVEGVRMRTLPQGAGAIGALAMGADFDAEAGQGGVVFLTSRAVKPAPVPPPVPAVRRPEGPTHLLLNHVAYPITAAPAAVVRSAEGIAVLASDAAGGEGERLCAVRQRDGAVWVEPVAEGVVRLGEEPLSAPRRAGPGDRLAVEEGGVELIFIQVRDRGET